MNDDQQEDIGMRSEMQNCVEEASIALSDLNGDTQLQINALVALGRFVVVETRPFHCRSTDAVVGSVKGIVADFATREEADAHISGLWAGSYAGDTDASLFVLPKVEFAPEPVSSTVGDESIPF